MEQLLQVQLYDSHTHLNDDAFYDDVPAFVARARHFGVNQMNMVGSNAQLNERAIKLAHDYPGLHAVIGWHPEDSKNYDAHAADVLVQQLQDPEVVGVGEIGLDYHWDTSPVAVQKRVLCDQLELAKTFNLPISVHCREALDDIYPILKKYHVGDFGGVMHSFAGNPEWAQKFLDLGMELSYSGVVTFGSAEDVRASAKITPDDRIMVETDAPYLTPKPYRGKMNEPAFTYFTVLGLAKLRNEDPVKLAQQTFANAQRLFEKRPS